METRREKSLLINTPAGNSNAVANVEARVLGLKVVGRRSTGDVELGDGALRRGSAKSLHGVLNVVCTGPVGAGLKVLFK